MFRALRLDKSDGEFQREFVTLDEGDLPTVGDSDHPELVVDVEYSTVNFKDALAVADQSPIVRSWPMVPGIDLAGIVALSEDSEVPVGQRVVVNGWGIGEETWGGLTQRARVRGSWTVPLPDGVSTAQAMAIGTAGYTSILCVLALEEHHTAIWRRAIGALATLQSLLQCGVAGLGRAFRFFDRLHRDGSTLVGALFGTTPHA